MKRRQGKITLADLGRRITGISTPFFGVSWRAPAADRDIIRAFLTFLEDRRVLFNPFQLEIEYQVQRSIQEIREQCTKTIAALPEKSPAIGPLRGIRSACRRFLDEPHVGFRHFRQRDFGPEGPEFFTALGEFRGAVGLHVGSMALLYQIELEPELAGIIPAADE